MNIQRGANIIIHDWVRLRGRERLLIVSSRRYLTETKALQQAAEQVSGQVDILMLDEFPIVASQIYKIFVLILVF